MRLTSLSQISHHMDDAESVISALEAIGLPLPNATNGVLSAEAHVALAAASGMGFSEHQVDEALAKTELPTTDRMALKLSLYRHQLLRKAA